MMRTGSDCFWLPATPKGPILSRIASWGAQEFYPIIPTSALPAACSEPASYRSSAHPISSSIVFA
jgi:hypothetical protein